MVLVLTLKFVALKTGFPPCKKILHKYFLTFFTFILCNFLVRMLQCLKKNLNLFFAHENLKKRASKVAHNRPQTFFSQVRPAAQTSPELIFHIIKCLEQASVLLSVL